MILCNKNPEFLNYRGILYTTLHIISKFVQLYLLRFDCVKWKNAALLVQTSH